LRKKPSATRFKKQAGNKAEAAKLLGINTTTVYRKMAKYNIIDT
jgi:transcriptional regulator of acetoin/glycerol metabolism